MTTPLTPIATALPATVSIPSNGESLTEASLVTFVQPIINAAEFIGSRVPGANRSAVPLEIMFGAGDAGTTQGLFGSPDWVLTSGPSVTQRLAWVQASRAIGDSIRWQLNSRLTQGMVIRGFTIDLIGQSSHAALPSIMPVARLVKSARGIGTSVYRVSAPVVTIVDSQTDSSANVTAYQLLHTITKTLSSPETIDLTSFLYELIIFGEGGANSIDQGFVSDARISVSA